MALAFTFPTDIAAAKTGVIYAFQGGSDGGAPYDTLIVDKHGNLFGTTAEGGGTACDGYGCGTVFELSKKGVETVLFAFNGGSAGATPYGGLLEDNSGDLFGTTSAGGGAAGGGTVFEIAADGSEHTLYTFRGGNDGLLPQAGLVADAAGNLYGTTEFGGSGNCSPYANGCGTLFKITPHHVESVLYTFGPSGAYPTSNLIFDKAGNLYGTTSGYPHNGPGTVFKLAPDGTLTTLYHFNNGGDGVFPIGGLVMDKAGNLYGTTFLGGQYGLGTVYEVTAQGSGTVLHAFSGTDGSDPFAGLLMDKSGNLFGAAGQSTGGSGTVFEIAAGGVFTVLHTFTGADGSDPSGGLVADGKNFVLTTVEGGGTSCRNNFGCGVVYALKKPVQK
jgi:uncharacterized repeat protein (TIGR03803 family)